MKTFTIELRVSFDADQRAQKEAVILEAAKTTARQLFTSALLVSDKQRPQMVLRVGDLFNSDEELSIIDGGYPEE